MPTQFTIGRRLRLGRRAEFEAVYAANVRVNAGPMTIHARRNDLAHPRLGLAIPQRVGSAATRHAIRRRIREAFRLLQHDWPAGYDVVVSVHPHEPLSTQEYQRSLTDAIKRVHTKWKGKRDQTQTAEEQSPARPPKS